MVDINLRNREEREAFYSCSILSCISLKMREEKWSVEVKKERTFWTFLLCLLHRKKKVLEKCLIGLQVKTSWAFWYFYHRYLKSLFWGMLRVFCVGSSRLWRQWEPLDRAWKMVWWEEAGYVCHTGFWLLPLSHLSCYRYVFAVSLKRCTHL